MRRALIEGAMTTITTTHILQNDECIHFSQRITSWANFFCAFVLPSHNEGNGINSA